jgi:hypothetical protein
MRIAAARANPSRDNIEIARAAAHTGRPREFVERATSAFDDALADLVQVDVLQNDGAAVSTFKRERPAGPDRLSAGDLELRAVRSAPIPLK